MFEIRPLQHLTLADLQALIVGYTSPANYQVTKTETPDAITIALRLVLLAPPYIKRYDPPDPETLEQYERVVRDGFSLGGYVDGQLMALAIAEPRWWNKSLWVWEFHIAPAQHRRGWGRRLMESLTHKARAAGLRTIVCETQTTNLPAIRFYQSQGFALEGVDVSYYSNTDLQTGEVAVFMKKNLDAQPFTDSPDTPPTAMAL